MNRHYGLLTHCISRFSVAALVLSLYACGGAGGNTGSSSSASITPGSSSVVAQSSAKPVSSSASSASSMMGTGGALTLKLSQSVTQEATGAFTQVSLGMPAISGGTGALSLTNNAPANGFRLGETRVEWALVDATGKRVTATQLVTITDTRGPQITPPPAITAMPSGNVTKVDLGTAVAEDLVDGMLSVSNNAPVNGFPMGTTTVIWMAQDKSGNGSTATQLVTITASPVSSTMSSKSSTPGVIRGKQEYDTQCAGCHAPSGKGGVFPLNNDKLTTLQMVNSIRDTMPKGNPGACGQTCAEDTTDYIKNVLFVGGSSSMSSAVSSSRSSASSIAPPSSSSMPSGGTSSIPSGVKVIEGVELNIRLLAGQKIYTGNENCKICHGENGQGTTLGKSLVNCASCSSWDKLQKVISDTMPTPNTCTGECANAVTDWVWSKINGWPLTSDGKGIRLATGDKKLGDDTQRIKSYESIVADYKRLFGKVPASLAASGSTFGSPVAYWYKNPEVGAVALNVLLNAAVEACGDEVMPNLVRAELEASCNTWATRFWLRPATAEERESCVMTALDSAVNLPVKQRAIFTCASMLISLPALTF